MDANDRELDEEVIADIKALLDYRISDSYARHFNVAPVSFHEALEVFGYKDEILAAVDNISTTVRPIETSCGEWANLAIRWCRDLCCSACAPADLPAYVNPLTTNGH